jgi:enamine deaminase RidA (YjgF/YER057c/UK114 family)
MTTHGPAVCGTIPSMGAEQNIAGLGIELPPAPRPLASYVPVRLYDGLAYVSGQIASVDGQVLHPGRLDSQVSVEHGQDVARRCALQILAALREQLGSLDRVGGVVQLGVFVASDPDFTQQPAIANAASDLLVEIFGDAGKHSRTAVGVASLPLGASVEVAALVALG